MPAPETGAMAARATGPAGADARIAKAHARLAGAGYGVSVPRAYGQAAPIVADALGTEQALALADAASRIAIRTRPRIAAQFLDLSVPMARRLAGPEPFGRWIALLVGVSKPAPDAVEPLLERMEMLHERLGLVALDAWVQSGLRLAAGDATRRRAYFTLDLAEAVRLLERHAGEDTFQSLEGELRATYRALWGHVPPIREALAQAKGHAALRASFGAGVIQLPSSYSGFRGRERLVYQAALAHIGAHMAYGGKRFEPGQLKPLQIAVVSLIEDARVETLALREMPGLKRLWLPFHDVSPDGMATTPSLFGRLARALIDPDFPLRHGWVRKGVEMFRAGQGQIDTPALSRHIGNILGNDLGQTRVQFNARDYVVQPVYRDDNLGLWELPPDPHQGQQHHHIDIATHDLRRSEETDRPQERKTERSERDTDIPPETVAPMPVASGVGRIVGQVPEYDHLAGIERPDWVTIKEYDPGPGDPLFWRKLEDRHGALLARIRALVRAAALGRHRRLKRQAEGERLDLDAAIEASIALRAQRTPDHRVYEGVSIPDRSIAVHLLLDISQSTGDPVGGGPNGAGDVTVLNMLRDATALLAHAMDRLGDPLAITAFASDGREDLRVVPVKRFEDALTPLTGMALSGLRAGYSTRIGAAIRHAGAALGQVACHRRLVLVVTDGAPSDIDVSDPAYLVMDARRAVQLLNAQGIDVFCIALGQTAGQRQGEIFSKRGFVQIDRLDALPEKLPALYLKMTR
ncbi:MAG: VWA domain-containing protein [Natronohydrobacter sp.]|nr:VWA domain-containing protein [Natronohydrobacter sp.]